MNTTLPAPASSLPSGAGTTPLRPLRLRCAADAARAATAVLAALAVQHAAAQPADAPALPEALALQVRQLILGRVIGPASPRAEVALGRLDPRLRLSACERVEPYLPTGARLWGASRVGLKCAEGPTRWNVYLPVTITVFGPGLVAAAPLPAGHVLAQADLRAAEINLSEQRSAAVIDASAAVGRTLAQALTAGQSLREAGLKSRQWFGPGETVQVRAVGGGFAIVGTGEALTAGMEGQPVRVRTDNGKVVSGMPVGERVVEITL